MCPRGGGGGEGYCLVPWEDNVLGEFMFVCAFDRYEIMNHVMKPVGSWRRSCVFIVNFEHISHLVLVFLLLTLSR